MTLKKLSILLTAIILLIPGLQSETDYTTSFNGKIVIRNDQTLFTAFAYVTIGSFKAVDRDRMPPLKEFVWKRLDSGLDPGYKQKIRQDIAPYLTDRMFEYNLTMLALNCTPPPHIRFLKEELEAHILSRGGDVERTMKTFKGLEKFPALLTGFYEKAGIAHLYEDCRPWYDEAIAVYKEKTSRLLDRALKYLKIQPEEISLPYDKVVIILNLIGPRGSAMGPIWKGVKYDVHSPWDSLSWSPHEFIHDMVAPVTKSVKYKAEILRLVEKVRAGIKDSAAEQYYQDPIDFFDECLVRTLDHLVTSDWSKSWERERVKEALAAQASRGFVLCRPMLESLALYENSALTFYEYFPGFLASVGQRIEPGLSDKWAGESCSGQIKE